MKKSLVFIFLCALLGNVQAKDTKLNYIAGLIPDSLKKNAHAVIREHHEKVEILSPSKTRTTVHVVITVLKEAGKSKAWMQVPYSSDSKIIELSAKGYNAIGMESNKWPKKDWKDIGYDTYGTAYSDYRVKVLKPGNNSYPYTIEYNYVYEESNTYGIDSWHPLWEDNLSVEKSSYELVYNPSMEVKYQPYNFTDAVKMTKTNNSLKCEVTNLIALKKEPYRPPLKFLTPYLRVGVKNFTYDKYDGNSSSWEDYGNFYNKISEGKSELPEIRKKEIDQIIAQQPDDLSKIRALYKYMQSHTRYVNISIGIGGIQPFSAMEVSENGYGDCKALSNYMKAILNYAGLKSHLTAIKAGAYQYEFDTDFVSHQGNHMILCVPLSKDTIWLECTSQTMPCGFLGDFTDNRPALILTENGGQLVRTPKYDKQLNKVVRNINIDIEESGTAKAHVNSTYTGLEYDEKHSLTMEDKESQLKILYKHFDLPNFKITDFNLDQTDQAHPQLHEELKLELNSYASKSGSRLFIPVNPASKWRRVPSNKSKRTYDIHKKSEYTQQDTVTFNIPDGYKIEVLPTKVEITNEYGVYKAETKVEANTITYTRLFESNSGIFPASEYDDFVAFYKKVFKADGALAILKKIE